MRNSHTLALLVVLGVSLGSAIKRDDEDTHEFKLIFGEKTGYSAVHKTDGIVRGPTSDTWSWPEWQAGKGESIQWFDFYTYKNEGDEDEEPKDHLKCTLSWLNTGGYPFISQEYELKSEHPWLASHLRRTVKLECTEAKNQTKTVIDSEEDLS